MANQGAMQAQQAAADIGRQERENRMMEAQGEMSIQQMKGARQELKARGAFDASMAQAQGQQVSDQLTTQRELAVGQMQLSAAQANASNALQAAAINQQGATDARNLEFQVSQANMSYWAGQQQAEFENEIADKTWWQSTFSDRKLKHNIVFIKKSPSGINIYNFEYKDSKLGIGTYQGVMSDEIPQEAVIKHSNGYDMVDYSKLDVNFIKIKD